MKREDAMPMPKDAVLLRIYTGEQQKHGSRPLYEAVVMKAREMNLAGATVLRGPLGFGQSSRIHSAKILDLSQDLPLVIEIVDGQEKIDAFLPVLDTMIGSGLVTIEKVQVLTYGPPQRGPAG
jgi:PII-like signaling protein